MQLLVVTAAASDQTGRTISLLIAGLIGIAVALTALTVWYWRSTSPGRRSGRVEPAPRTIELVDSGPGWLVPDRPRTDGDQGAPMAPADHMPISRTSRPQPDPRLLHHGTATGPPGDRTRPVVASVPPDPIGTAAPGPVAPNDGAIRPHVGIEVETDRSIERQATVTVEVDGPLAPAGRIGAGRPWMDPDVWVDAFASQPEHPGPAPSSASVGTAAAMTWAADAASAVPGPVTVDVSGGREPIDQPPVGPAARPNDALSDVDWESITSAAFAQFAESESPGDVDADRQPPQRWNPGQRH